MTTKPYDVRNDPTWFICDSKKQWIQDLVKLCGRSGAYDWILSPHPQLDGKTPKQVYLEGDEAKVATIVDQLASGAYV